MVKKYFIWFLCSVLLSVGFFYLFNDWPILLILVGGVNGLITFILFLVIDRFLVTKLNTEKKLLIRLITVITLVLVVYYVHSFIEHAI